MPILLKLQSAEKSTIKSSNSANTGEITVGKEVEKRLIDLRDGKKYWVSKMADQNCWMAQNLALDLTAGEVLTPSTSDVSQEWVVPTGTIHGISNGMPVEPGSDVFWNIHSWNLGEYVLATPDRGEACISEPSEGQNNQSASLCPGQTLDQCSDFQNVANGWEPTLSAKDRNGTLSWKGYTGDSILGTYIAADEATKTYDARYLIGNYYSYNAAAAGSGGEELSSGNADNVTNTQELNALLKNAPDSICPKGWQLPRSGANYTTKAPFDLDDSYYRLLLAYGDPTSDKYGLPGVPGYTSIIKNQNKKTLVKRLSIGYDQVWRICKWVFYGALDRILTTGLMGAW